MVTASITPGTTGRGAVSALDRALGLLGELLVTAGVLILLFVAWQLWWTDQVADRQQAQTTSTLQRDWGTGATGGDPANPPVATAPALGRPFAVVHIPRFGSGWQQRPVMEGTKLSVLEEGVGHYTDTAMPGAIGNVALAGHRVTYGRPFFAIADLQDGDAIVVESEGGWYTYRVSGRQIVPPAQVDVIAPVPDQPGAAPTERMLTLTTCHPKYSARERYVVYARYETWQPRSAGEPESLALPQGVS